MMRARTVWTLAAVLLTLAAGCRREATPAAAPPPSVAAVAADPLPSWNDGATKKSIVDFVGRVTKEGGPDFVRPAERIATFDNDGTLWSEKPVPFEVVFAFDQVKALAPQHPEWRTKAPFASVLEGDMTGVAASGEKGVLAIIAATHTGMTTDEFRPQFATGSRRPNIRKRSGCSRTWSTSRCWSGSSDGSAVVRSRRSATRTATCRCCSGPPPAPAYDLRSSSTTTMRRGSSRTIARTSCSSSTRGGTRRWPGAGRS